jgi:hypothetical protein
VNGNTTEYIFGITEVQIRGSVHFEKLLVAQILNKFPSFMALKVTLPSSQVPAIASLYKPDDSHIISLILIFI